MFIWLGTVPPFEGIQMYSSNEKIRILKKIDAAPNRNEAIRISGISRTTYYNWKKILNESGVEGLNSLQRAWSKEEDTLLISLIQADVDSSELSSQLPGRKPKSIRWRVSKLGYSIKQERVKYRSVNGKKCSQCAERKQLDSFYEAAYDSIDGRMSLCKSCFNVSGVAYKEANRASINRNAAAYRQRLRDENPFYSTEYQREYRKTGRGMFMTLKKNCSANPHRKHMFLLEWIEFESWFEEQPESCHYCGITLADYLSIRELLPGRSSGIGRLTIDRKDSRLPYQIENVVLACFLCNYLKGYAFSEIEFSEIAAKYVAPYLRNLGVEFSG